MLKHGGYAVRGITPKRGWKHQKKCAKCFQLYVVEPQQGYQRIPKYCKQCSNE